MWKKQNLQTQLVGFHVSFPLCFWTCKTSDSCLHAFIRLLRSRLLRSIMRANASRLHVWSYEQFEKSENMGSMLVVLWVKHVFGCVAPQKVMALKFGWKELLPRQLRTTLRVIFLKRSPGQLDPKKLTNQHFYKKTLNKKKPSFKIQISNSSGVLPIDKAKQTSIKIESVGFHVRFPQWIFLNSN